MKKNFLILPVLVLALIFVFSSCQKEEILKQEIASTSNPTRPDVEAIANSSFYPSPAKDLFCTMGDGDCNPGWGGCLIMFPPDGPYDNPWEFNQARGLSFVGTNDEITLYLFNDMPIPASLKNTSQPFSLHQDFVIPASVVDDLYGGTNSPGEVIMPMGTYSAQFAENYLPLSVPTSSTNVNLVIWSNEVVNSSEMVGYLHNKWIADILSDKIAYYSTLSSPEEIHAVVTADVEAFSNQYGLGNYDLSSLSITGQSSAEMIQELQLTAYEKIFLTNFVSDVSDTDLFTVEGLSAGLVIINSYEAAATDDPNISNSEAVLGFLATSKHSAMYWSIANQQEGGSSPQRIKRGWWTAICDAVGFGIGFLGGGPVGGVVTGVANSVVGYLTYNYFF